MSKERILMEGKLSELAREEYHLTLKIEGLTSAIRENLNTALTPVEELEIPQAAQQMRDLESAFVSLQGVLSQMKRINRELGRGN